MSSTLHISTDMPKDQPLTIPSTSTHCFRLYGDPILTLRANGIVEIAKDHTPSEAGAAFLDYVREHWPKEESCRRIRLLEQAQKQDLDDAIALAQQHLNSYHEAKERIRRLEEAGDRLFWMAPPGLKDSRVVNAKAAWTKAKEAKP